MLIFLLHALTVSLHFSLYSETPNHFLLNIRLIFKVTALSTSTLNTCIAAAAKSLQSCLTLFDPIDGSPPGSPVPGILQARTLEWVAISFSNAWKWKVKVKLLSRVRLLATPWSAAHQAPLSMGFSHGVGCHCLLPKYLLIHNKIRKNIIWYCSKSKKAFWNLLESKCHQQEH